MENLRKVNCLKITPDKQYLAAAGNPHVRVFEINSHHSSALASYDGHTTNVTDVGESYCTMSFRPLFFFPVEITPVRLQYFRPWLVSLDVSVKTEFQILGGTGGCKRP